MLRRNFLRMLGGSAFGLVNFTDFADFAQKWLVTKHVEDLAEFADSWLEKKDMQIEGDWTISFFWLADISYRQIQDKLPILFIRGQDGSYLDVYYTRTVQREPSIEQTESKFVITDGTETDDISFDDGFAEVDVTKVAVVRGGGEIKLYIETVEEGTKVATITSTDVEDVCFIQLAKNSDDKFGTGLFAPVEVFNEDLTQEQVQDVFDLDGPESITPEYTFHRKSIRCNKSNTDVTEYGINEPVKEIRPVAGRPELNHDADNMPYSFEPWFVDGDTVYGGSPWGTTELRKTTDGVNFEVEWDFTTHPDYVDGELLRSGQKLADGSWIVNAVYHGGTDAERYSKFFRKDVGTGEWELVHTLQTGYLLRYGWSPSAQVGSHIVVGEYSRKFLKGRGERVYYSNDYGKNWIEIYEGVTLPEPEVGDDRHCHTVSFAADNPDVVYVAYGDGDYRGFHKVVCNNPADRMNPQSWSGEPMTHYHQPTAAINHEETLVWGNDGRPNAPLFTRHYPDDTFRMLTHPLHYNTSENAERHGLLAPVLTQEAPENYIWKIQSLQNAYYAAARRDYKHKIHAGCYVSVDTEHWIRVRPEPLDDIVGVTSDGRIWVSYRHFFDPENYTHCAAYFEGHKVKNVEMIRVDAGVENHITNLDDTCFESGIGNWSFAYGFDESNPDTGWDNTVSLYGGGSIKARHSVGGSSIGDIRLNGATGGLEPGDKFTLSCYVKLGGAFRALAGGDGNERARRPIVRLRLGSSAKEDEVIYHHLGATVVAEAHEGWHRLVSTGEIVEPGHSDDLVIRVSFAQQNVKPQDYADYWLWVDCVQITKHEHNHDTGAFQPGGTPRADEYLIVAADDKP